MMLNILDKIVQSHSWEKEKLEENTGREPQGLGRCQHPPEHVFGLGTQAAGLRGSQLGWDPRGGWFIPMVRKRLERRMKTAVSLGESHESAPLQPSMFPPYYVDAEPRSLSCTFDITILVILEYVMPGRRTETSQENSK